MSFDSTIILVINGADIEVVFEFLEDLFDFGENDVLFPEFFGVIGAEVGAQQIGAFAPAGFTQFFPIEAELECSGFPSANIGTASRTALDIPITGEAQAPGGVGCGEETVGGVCDRRIAQWMKRYKPDAVIGVNDAVYHMLASLGWPGLAAGSFASVMQGEDEFSEVPGTCFLRAELGALAVRVLDGLIRRRETGKSESPVRHLIGAVWREVSSGSISGLMPE
jgi:hypothetical protein